MVGQQSGEEGLEAALESARDRPISAAAYVELAIVNAHRFGDQGSRMVDDILRSFSIAIEPVTARQAIVARQAFYEFGKGRHKTALNFGDCFSYALANGMGDELLFVGADFRLTDVRIAS